MTESELSAWLTLSFIPKIGGVTLSRLLAFDSPINLLQYTVPQWQALGLKPAQMDYLQQNSFPQVEQCLAWQQSPQQHIITPLCGGYPPLLQQIASLPPVLFVKGNLDCLVKSQVAMVGSRNASLEGLKAAKDLAFELAQAGVIVTSGLALGVDGHAHDGALLAGGETIAVLGSGLEHIYPARHKKLAQRIVEQGALVSEFWPSAPPRAENFPRRNRIISGLSLGTLVIEAAERSGSLITARYALDQGRDVFALPGAYNLASTQGSNRLIKQGAFLVQSLQDVLDELNLTLPHSLLVEANQSPQALVEQSKTLPFAELLANVGNEATPVDILAERTHIPVHEVMMQILELELAGYVVAVPGGYIRNSK